MGTDYSPTAPSRIELFARVLIACRDHSLPVPASVSFHSADGASLFLTTDYEWNEWAAFLGPSSAGIKRDFYGWHLTVMTRGDNRLSPELRALVDNAVSDHESADEVSVIQAFNRIAPEAISRIETRAGQCLVPYIRNVSDDGMLYDLVSECVRPKGHLGDHADGAHQWKNDYNDTDFRTVTP